MTTSKLKADLWRDIYDYAESTRSFMDGTCKDGDVNREWDKLYDKIEEVFDSVYENKK